MSDIKELTEKFVQFRDERDWKQFHNPKDMAISLALEAAEVMEHFQWKQDGDLEEYIKTHKEEIGEELADVLGFVLLMAEELGIDIKEATEKKIAKNAKKYPVEKSKGNHTKYTEL